MARIFDRFRSFLRSHFETEDLEREGDDDMISFLLQDEGGNEWQCLALADEQSEQAIFYSVVLESTPPEHRLEVMKFVTLANFGMQVGNFELDLEDGEVRFKTSIDLENEEVSEGLLRNLVELNILMMGLYYDGLLAVMRGSMTAEEAIAEVEDDGSDEDEAEAEDDAEQR